MDGTNRIFGKCDKKCNKDNELLLLEDNNCFIIEEDKHLHGGYI